MSLPVNDVQKNCQKRLLIDSVLFSLLAKMTKEKSEIWQSNVPSDTKDAWKLQWAKCSLLWDKHRLRKGNYKEHVCGCKQWQPIPYVLAVWSQPLFAVMWSLQTLLLDILITFFIHQLANQSYHLLIAMKKIFLLIYSLLLVHENWLTTPKIPYSYGSWWTGQCLLC